MGAMRVLIDARMMGALATRGIGRVVTNLVSAWKRYAPEDELTILSGQEPPVPGLRWIKAHVPWYGPQEQTTWLFWLYRASRDVDWTLFPHWNVPIFYFKRYAVFLHDLILLNQPFSQKTSTRWFVWGWIKFQVFRYSLVWTLWRAKLIFVPTQYVREDVIRRFSFLKRKLVVVGEGIDVGRDEEPVAQLSEHFLLYVGSAYPHKRLDVLFEAWQEIAKRFSEYELVIGGEKDLFMRRWMDYAARAPLPRVRFLGRLTDKQIVYLMNRASLFVFPSDEEGFGLPPLEALAHGCPVVSSDAPCLKEVLPAQGVRFFRRGDVRAMIETVDSVLRALPGICEEARVYAKTGSLPTWQQAISRLHHALVHATTSFAENNKRTTR